MQNRTTLFQRWCDFLRVFMGQWGTGGHNLLKGVLTNWKPGIFLAVAFGCPVICTIAQLCTMQLHNRPPQLVRVTPKLIWSRVINNICHIWCRDFPDCRFPPFQTMTFDFSQERVTRWTLHWRVSNHVIPLRRQIIIAIIYTTKLKNSCFNSGIYKNDMQQDSVRKQIEMWHSNQETQSRFCLQQKLF